MANYCFFVPLLPGGIERVNNWVRNEIPTKGHDEVFGAAGVTREEVWLQSTPQGEFIVVSLETDNPKRALETFGNSAHPWAAKFRDYAMDAHGVDFTNPPPTNKQLAHWNRTTTTVKAQH